MARSQHRPALLPARLTAEFQQAFAALPPGRTLTDVGRLLTSDVAAQLVGATLAELGELEDYFVLAGPGSFYYGRVVDGLSGFVKVHVFAPSDIAGGKEAPHSHRSLVVSAIYRGSIANTVYEFKRDPAGDKVVDLVAPGGQVTSRRAEPPVIGITAVRARHRLNSTAAGTLYAVSLDEIHTAGTVAGAAVTLCYFGPQVATGKLFNPVAGTPEKPPVGRVMWRPTDLIKE